MIYPFHLKGPQEDRMLIDFNTVYSLILLKVRLRKLQIKAGWNKLLPAIINTLLIFQII